MSMTREELMISEAQKRYDDIAFLDGVKWADEHPNLESIWHDAGEEPRCNELLLGEDTDGFSIYRWCGQEDNWEAFVNKTGLRSWAYIKDLLQKGGKK